MNTIEISFAESLVNRYNQLYHDQLAFIKNSGNHTFNYDPNDTSTHMEIVTYNGNIVHIIGYYMNPVNRIILKCIDTFTNEEIELETYDYDNVPVFNMIINHIINTDNN